MKWKTPKLKCRWCCLIASPPKMKETHLKCKCKQHPPMRINEWLRSIIQKRLNRRRSWSKALSFTWMNFWGKVNTDKFAKPKKHLRLKMRIVKSTLVRSWRSPTSTKKRWHASRKKSWSTISSSLRTQSSSTHQLKLHRICTWWWITATVMTCKDSLNYADTSLRWRHA